MSQNRVSQFQQFAYYLLHLHLAPHWVTPFEFRRDLLRQKTRVLEMSFGVTYVILRLAVLIQYRRVTDGQHFTVY